jgi:hypothetical protein
MDERTRFVAEELLQQQTRRPSFKRFLQELAKTCIRRRYRENPLGLADSEIDELFSSRERAALRELYDRAKSPAGYGLGTGAAGGARTGATIVGDVSENDLASAGARHKGGKMIRILFLAANPSDTSRLRVDEESRSIDQALRQTEFRDRFDILQHFAVRVGDLQGYLLRHTPDIVHFSGHGSVAGEIIMEDSLGHSRPVSARALSTLFSVLRDNVRCVVLNACYSEEQAKAIAEHIDCVIGMSQAIGDQSAIAFATAFYQALGYGRDVKTAFDLGCVQIDLDSLDDQDVPKLLAARTDPSQLVFAAE